MRKILNIKLILVFFIALFLLIVWFLKFTETNNNAYKQYEETVPLGQWSNIEENFFVDASENMNGYSVKVNSTEIVKYTEYLTQNGGDEILSSYTEQSVIPDYICLVNVTVKNDGNTDGALPVLYYSMYSKSLNMPIDFEIWSLIDENFDGTPYIKLIEDSEATMTIPFTPMSYDIGINNDKVNSMIKEENFYLCISYFPIRKLIEIDFN